MEALEKIFEEPGLPQAGLPASLAGLYGGGLGFETPVLYANFVSSLDGVVALPDPGVSSGPAISGRSEADRFVMGLLRAFAGVVLVGAGTVRADRGHLWTPDHIYPPAAAQFAQLRAQLGLSPRPLLAVLSARGDLEPAEPALQAGALVLSGGMGAGRLRDRLPGATRLIELAEPISAAAVVGVLRAEGHAAILTEGGPTLMGGLLEAGVVDQLFLTLSPVVAGRDGPGRPGFVEGLELLPRRPLWSRLLSVRKHRSHLFLRYALTPSAASSQEIRSGSE